MSENNGTLLRRWLPLLIWIITTLIGVTMAYASLRQEDAVMQQRVTNIEQRQDRMERTLMRIEDKVDLLLNRR